MLIQLISHIELAVRGDCNVFAESLRICTFGCYFEFCRGNIKTTKKEKRRIPVRYREGAFHGSICLYYVIYLQVAINQRFVSCIFNYSLPFFQPV